MYDENIIIKDWRYIDLSFGLIYPSHYKIGISSYTIRLLYYLLNSKEQLVCERIFLPEGIKFPASKDQSSINRIRSIENKVLPKDFDILGFSVHYENDFKNVLWILEKAQIPLTHEKRVAVLLSEENDLPLIIGGGPAITSNPLPLSNFFDAFFIGDSEPNLFKFLEITKEFKNRKLNYIDLLKKYTNIEGIFVPSLKNSVKRVILTNLDDSPIPISQLIAKSDKEKKIFEENFFLEVNRGCPFKCKFCISSYHNSPFRNRSYENIIQTIDDAIKIMEFKKFSLIGSCVSSHPQFYKILDYIIKKGKEFSLPSIRLDHITPNIIDLFEKGNIKTITIAPEAGSESLRFELGKKISNRKIFEVLELIKDSKLKSIKFYFLIGLPSEKDEDVQEIVEFLKEIDEMGFHWNSLKVNINPFIPKFNTPYGSNVYYYLSDNIKKLLTKFQLLEKDLSNLSTIKLKFQKPKELVNAAKIQTIFSLGDEDFSDFLLKFYMMGANMGALRRLEKELDLSLDSYFYNIQNGYKPWNI
ncbi:MAG: B12-binding domain-containing radical SAM protein [Candidatus Thorarchaeota archaeon]